MTVSYWGSASDTLVQTRGIHQDLMKVLIFLRLLRAIAVN